MLVLRTSGQLSDIWTAKKGQESVPRNPERLQGSPDSKNSYEERKNKTEIIQGPGPRGLIVTVFNSPIVDVDVTVTVLDDDDDDDDEKKEFLFPFFFYFFFVILLERPSSAFDLQSFYQVSRETKETRPFVLPSEFRLPFPARIRAHKDRLPLCFTCHLTLSRRHESKQGPGKTKKDSKD